MIKYRPDSYSKQARELADDIIKSVNNGGRCIEEAERFFQTSYRCDLIRYRMVKRFRRALRNGKIHETLESVQNWKEYKEEYHVTNEQIAIVRKLYPTKAK